MAPPGIRRKGNAGTAVRGTAVRGSIPPIGVLRYGEKRRVR